MKSIHQSLLQNSAAKCSCASAKRRLPIDGASQKRLYRILQEARQFYQAFRNRLCLWSVVTFACSSPAQETTLQFAKVARPPELKGDLSDPLWQKAQVHRTFFLLRKQEAPRAGTEVYPLYDDECLYLGVVCHEPGVDKMVVKAKKHDDAVFGDDDIEVFLGPNQTRMFQFITNSIGAQFESGNAFYETMVTDAQWDNPWQARTARGKEQWSAEFRIPFSILGLDAQTQPRWVLNVCRGRQVEPEYSSLIPVNSFWDWPVITQRIKTSRLEVDFSQYFYAVADLVLVSGYAGKNKFENWVKFTVTNSTGKPAAITANVFPLVDGVKGEPLTGQVDLADQEKKTVSIACPSRVLEAQTAQWLVELKNRPTGRVVFAHVFNRPDRKPVMEVVVKKPFYRNTLFEGQDREVMLDLKINSRVSGLPLTFAIRKDGQVLDTTHSSSDKPQQALDFRRYGPGTYKVETKLDAPGGESVARDVQEIRIVPKAAGSEVTIDPGQFLRVNGMPTFPIGFYHAPVRELEALKKEGFNANFSYDRAVDLDPNGLQKMLTTEFVPLEKLGMVRMVDMEGVAFKDFSRPELSVEEVAAVKRTVEAVKGAPSLLLYYLHDEPEGRNVSPDQLRHFSRLVKDLDPYHPTLILGHTIGINRYFVSDIYMPDAYIDCQEGKVGELGVVKGDLELAGETLKRNGGKGMVMVTLKAIDYTPEDSGARAPTFEEMRNACYDAIIHGARGIFYYTYVGHSGVKAYPECWEATRIAAREVSCLAPAIMQGTPVAGVRCANPQIRLFARQHEGRLLLIALNSKPEATDATLQIEADAPALKVLSEKREVRLAQHSFKEHFEACEVHVYTTDDRIPAFESVQEIKTRLKRRNEELLRSDNVALAAKGTRISSSTAIAWGGKLRNIINGIPDDSQTLMDNVTPEKPQWIQLDFASPRKIQQAVIYNANYAVPKPTLVDYQLQVKKDGQWVTVADRKNNGDMVIKEKFDPVETAAIRLFITKQVAGDRFAVNEFEVY